MSNKYAYLENIEFLDKVYNARIRTQYAKIILLNFDETPIKEIQGIITSGSASINGSAAVRRTINLSLIAPAAINDLTNIENFISINKKIKVEIGLKNPFSHFKYDDILWFPMGVYVLSTASLARGTGGTNISITAKDKMSKLDGTVGGTLPASVSFHEIYEEDESGNITITTPTIYQIIMEAVNHYGEEDISNIFIDDVDETARMLIKYIGSDPIYFNANYTGFSYNDPGGTEGTNKHTATYGKNIGYRVTSFTYPGELVLGAGETVASLLDKIAKTLGNYEFFYDVEGKFHFQQIKNYKNSNSPIDKNGIDIANYFQTYGNDQAKYKLTDERNLVSLNVSPKIDNIKNDFIVWGARTTANGITIPIRYHAVINTKPENNLNKMWYYYSGRVNGNLSAYTAVEFVAAENQISKGNKYSKLSLRSQISEDEGKEIEEIIFETINNKNAILSSDIIFSVTSDKYQKFTCEAIEIEDIVFKASSTLHFNSNKSISFPNDFLSFKDSNNKKLNEYVFSGEEKITIPLVRDASSEGDLTPSLISYDNPLLSNLTSCEPGEAGGWREELYRQALVNQSHGTLSPYEEAELVAEWRKIYDPNKDANSKDEDGNKLWTEDGWLKAVFDDPGQLSYWLDYIDLPEYSVSAIGRRTKAVTNDKVTSLWQPTIPTVIFYDASDQEKYDIINASVQGGYQTFQLNENDSKFFSMGSSSLNAIDEIRTLIRQHLTYNTQISITCLPMYHMEPNNLIYIFNTKTGIDSNYQITQFNLPLAYNGTMSITATEVINQY